MFWLFVSLFLGMWAIWFAVWRVMALRVKAPSSAESLGSRLSHLLPVLVGAFLLVPLDLPLPLLNARFVPLAIWPAALGAALTFAGLAFCVWARVILADNWSSDVQLKRGHELVVAGPYRWVRHPIYTGLLLMFLGTAFAVGEWRGLLGVALAGAGFWRKLGIEEAVMRRQFGDAYARYAERAPALIPFVL